MNPWELENPYWNFETRNRETVMIFSLRKQRQPKTYIVSLISGNEFFIDHCQMSC